MDKLDSVISEKRMSNSVLLRHIRERACLEYFPKVESCRTTFLLKIELICHNCSLNARYLCILGVGMGAESS